jgi:hypothetical protein
MKTKDNKISSALQKKWKKNVIVFSAFLFQAGVIFSQTTTYDNFEGKKAFYYGERSGVLDTMSKGPGTGDMNTEIKCAKYVRNGQKPFDNIKLNFTKKLMDVNKYATYTGVPPKMSMKVYTTAPVGTLIEIQLGKTGKNDFPAGVNSVFQGHITVSNAWEEVQFKFSQIPQGSKISANQVDQLTLLFNPNSSTSDTYYFYDIKGPGLSSDKLESIAPTDNTKAKPVKNSKTGTE